MIPDEEKVWDSLREFVFQTDCALRTLDGMADELEDIATGRGPQRTTSARIRSAYENANANIESLEEWVQRCRAIMLGILPNGTAPSEHEEPA